jgi:putative toxin-antitoxin system antitoxin component (TIGR02293 family)
VLTEEQKTEIQLIVESHLLELLRLQPEFKKSEPIEIFGFGQHREWLQSILGALPIANVMSEDVIVKGLAAKRAQAKATQPSNAPSSPQTLETLVRVIARAVEVLGTSEKALRWINAPVRSLGDQTPASLLGSPEGIARVEDALGRIEHGVW